MSTYQEQVLTEKKYTGNVVIKIGPTYFSIREPDSGLVVGSPNNVTVTSLLLNPTQVDVRKVTTTISSFSFRLLDKVGGISILVLGDAANLIGQEVRIYLGRSGVGMDFADYFQLPLTYLSKCEHSDNSYNFSSSEQTERMARPLYAFDSALAGDILVGTTIWTMRDSLVDFPPSGFLKIDDEFVSYASIDLVNNRFNGVIRGELNSVPAEHSQNTTAVLVETITDNPLNIILKLLISGGGGGVYDTLQDGLGIAEALVDIAEIEALRDDIFFGDTFTLSLYSIDSALKYIETELLMPNGLRLTTSRASKITTALLDKARFVEEDDVIDEDTITKFPKWTLDGLKVTNSIEVQWGFNEGTGVFEKKTVFTDPVSIATYGASTALKYQFRGIKTALDGDTLVQDFGSRLLARLAYPTPQISIVTQIDKSLQTVGDKAYLVSSQIPAADGSLNFASNLEIISRAINQTSGDVTLGLAFTSYTNFRSAFISPSDLILSVASQSKVGIVAGRGAQYLVGWYMLLWDEVARVYLSDPPNKIIDIMPAATERLLTEGGDGLLTESGDSFVTESASAEDQLTFENAWATTLTAPNNLRLRFANYNEAITSQKRYGFISDSGANFDDTLPTYKVTY